MKSDPSQLMRFSLLALVGWVLVAPSVALAEWIGDPENPAFEDDWIGDPENPSTPRRQARACDVCPVPPPPPLFRASWDARLSSSLRRDDATEETLALEQFARARLRHRLDKGWTITLEGELRLSIYGAAEEGAPLWRAEPDRTRAVWETELGTATLSRRSGPWILVFGNQIIRWGVSDLLSPADILNPRDFRRGFFAPDQDTRIPVPAANVTWATPSLAVQGVLLPVLVPHRVPLMGTRQALLRPAFDLGIPTQVSDTFDELIHPSVLPQVEDLLLGTQRPQPVPAHASLGARVTWSTPGQDLSVGALYGWDRIPSLTLVDDWEQLVSVLADGPANPLELLPLLGLLDDPGSLFQTRYDRRLWLVADGVRTFGPWGLRAEAVYSPLATTLVDGGLSLRRPGATGLVGLSWEGDAENVLVTTEFITQRTFFRDDDPQPLLLDDPLRGVAAGLRMRPAAFGAFSGPQAERWTLTLGGLVLVPDVDLLMSGELAWEPGDRQTLAVGATVLTTVGDQDGLGARLQPSSHATIRYQARF